MASARVADQTHPGRDRSPDFKAFERDDGSIEQRLNLLDNASKHLKKRIAAGQILADTVSPTWLSNRGLECTDGFLSWEETAEVLREIAKWAEVASSLLPQHGSSTPPLSPSSPPSAALDTITRRHLDDAPEPPSSA